MYMQCDWATHYCNIIKIVQCMSFMFQGGTSILPLIFVYNMSLCVSFRTLINLYIDCLFVMMLFWLLCVLYVVSPAWVFRWVCCFSCIILYSSFYVKNRTWRNNCTDISMSKCSGYIYNRSLFNFRFPLWNLFSV